MLLLLLAACHRQPAGPVEGSRVAARDYDAFYLWPGVHPPPETRPGLLYLLDGEVRRDGPPCLIILRPGTPHLPGRRLWLVVRLDRLDWDEALWRTLLGEMARWQAAGNDLQGLQLDFDAATHGIDRYAQFLAEARRRLPRRWQLSITGLMDWSAHGDPAALTRLAGVIDEVVVQTYQGRDTIPGYDTYFRGIARLPIPFRVALAEGGRWQAPSGLGANPRFRGYVVFMIPKRRPQAGGSATIAVNSTSQASLPSIEASPRNLQTRARF